VNRTCGFANKTENGNMQLKFMNVLTRELEKSNETAASLSKRLGLSKSIIHGWLQGAAPSGKHLEKIYIISELFGLSLTELLFDIKDPKERITLFTSSFLDSNKEYLIKVERINRKN